MALPISSLCLNQYSRDRKTQWALPFKVVVLECVSSEKEGGCTFYPIKLVQKVLQGERSGQSQQEPGAHLKGSVSLFLLHTYGESVLILEIKIQMSRPKQTGTGVWCNL